MPAAPVGKRPLIPFFVSSTPTLAGRPSSTAFNSTCTPNPIATRSLPVVPTIMHLLPSHRHQCSSRRRRFLVGSTIDTNARYTGRFSLAALRGGRRCCGDARRVVVRARGSRKVMQETTLAAARGGHDASKFSWFVASVHRLNVPVALRASSSNARKRGVGTDKNMDTGGRPKQQFRSSLARVATIPERPKRVQRLTYVPRRVILIPNNDFLSHSPPYSYLVPILSETAHFLRLFLCRSNVFRSLRPIFVPYLRTYKYLGM